MAGEKLRPTGEFKVVTEGVDIVYRWLRLNDLAAETQPNLDPTIILTLPIGAVDLGSTVLTTLNSAVHYTPGDDEYQINTFFESCLQPKPTESIFAGAVILDLDSEGSVSQHQIPRGSQVKVSEILPSLSANLRPQDYAIEYDDEKDAILIRPSGGDNSTFILHTVRPDPIRQFYSLHINKQLDEETEEGFEQAYRMHGELVKTVVDALHQKDGAPSVDKTYTISPPKNIKKLLARMQGRLDIQRRMLQLNGALGNGQLDAETRKRIVSTERPRDTFDDVGGLESVKEELRDLADGLRGIEDYSNWGTKPPKSILLWGLPGTGKTLLARATANAAEATIYVVRVSEILRSLLGQTEQIVQGIFDDAHRNQPAIIFFDELDSVATNRDSHLTIDVGRHIVSILLTNLDGFEQNGARVAIIAATNRLDIVDPALFRAGRFRPLEVGKPGQEARKRIFEIHVNNARRNAGRELFESDLDLNKLASDSTGCTGAEIKDATDSVLRSKARKTRAGGSPSAVTATELIEEIMTQRRGRGDKTGNAGFVAITR